MKVARAGAPPLRSTRGRATAPRPKPRGPDRIRLIETILVTAVGITPLALITGVFISHDVIPKVIVLASCAALLLFLLPQWWPLLNVLRAQSTGRLFLILILAQFTSLLVSTIFSSQIPLSLAGTVWRRFGLIEQTAGLVIAAALACAAVSRPAWIYTLVKAVSVCGALAATYGILQYFHLDPFLDRRLYAIDYFGGVARPPGTMGHALYFSAYLLPVMFLAISGALADAETWWRRVYAVTAVLAGAAIILSGTRSATIAAGAGGILLAWRAIRGRRRNSSMKVFAAAFLLLLATAVFILSPAGANLRNRMLTESGGPRLQMWRECRALIGRHLLLGEGPETFAGEFRKIQSAELSREYPDFYNETPHNALIDAACAQGMPGVLILAGVFALVWFAGRGAIARQNPMMWGIEAGMLGILVSSMFASLTLVTSLYLWSMAGLAVAIPHIYNPASSGARGSERDLQPGFFRVPAIALGVVFLAAGTLLALQDSAWASLGSAVEDNDFVGARDAWSRATNYRAGAPGYELWASREWAVFGRSLGASPEGVAAWEMAAASASLAETGSEERFSAAYQASVLAVAAGDLSRAESEARETIRLAPNWYKGHLVLSQELQIAGKGGEAASEARLSETLGWKK